MQTMYKANDTPINLLQDTDIIVIECNLKQGESLIDSRLKDCKFIICNFFLESWSMNVISMDGYSLNSYDDKSCGVVYIQSKGTVKFQYSSDTRSILNKIIGIK